MIPGSTGSVQREGATSNTQEQEDTIHLQHQRHLLLVVAACCLLLAGVLSGAYPHAPPPPGPMRPHAAGSWVLGDAWVWVLGRFALRGLASDRATACACHQPRPGAAAAACRSAPPEMRGAAGYQKRAPAPPAGCS
jgi:hypothetical protein